MPQTSTKERQMSLNLNLNELEAAVGKMTPGPWMDNPHYECAHTHNASIGLRPVYHYSHNNPNATTDSAGLVALRNAAPELIAAARERDELAALLREARSVVDTWQAIALARDLGTRSLDLLAKRIDAALAKVGP